jgi:carbonic anhydrase
MSPKLSSERALERLKAGNRQYVEERSEGEPPVLSERRLELLRQQDPFAIIVGCADSRVPSELVFDAGLGDLFVIRVAGNVMAPSQIGSVEYAAKRFGTRLAVVLGHSHCGAVTAALEELDGKASYESPNFRSIVDRIRPAVEPLLDRKPELDPEERLRQAVRANVRAAAAQLRDGSALVERLVEDGELLVVGAEYCLETGVVEFFDD